MSLGSKPQTTTVALTSTLTATLLAAPAAGLKLYIKHIRVTNAGAATTLTMGQHAAAGAPVRDGERRQPDHGGMRCCNGSFRRLPMRTGRSLTALLGAPLGGGLHVNDRWNVCSRCESRMHQR